MSRTYDIIVWGATGFTGTLVANYLSKGKGYKWAIAGRNQEKLQNIIQNEIQGNNTPGIIVADLGDRESLRKMIGSTKVLLSTAGPFVKVGSLIVEICIQEKTDYCDITGEVAWVSLMIEKYGEQAKANNVVICNCCGFDSIPSDLGTLYGVTKLREFYGSNTKIGSATTYGAMRGGLSGGTLASGILWETDPVSAKRMDDVFLLGGRPNVEIPEDQDFKGYKFDPKIGSFIAPFGMAMVNSRIVRRSSMLLNYGDNFHYQEVAIAPSEEAAKKMAKPGPPAEKKANMMEQGRLPKPGSGPSAEMRAKSWFKMLVNVSDDTSKKSVWVTVAGGDPGYDETSKMVSESAICLATQRNAIPASIHGGGFLSPAAAMGTVLVERLIRAGIRFNVETPPQASRL